MKKNYDELNIYLSIHSKKYFKGVVSMTFQDQIFAKGFIYNGILVGPVSYFTKNLYIYLSMEI